MRTNTVYVLSVCVRVCAIDQTTVITAIIFIIIIIICVDQETWVQNKTKVWGLDEDEHKQRCALTDT